MSNFMYLVSKHQYTPELCAVTSLRCEYPIPTRQRAGGATVLVWCGVWVAVTAFDRRSVEGTRERSASGQGSEVSNPLSQAGGNFSCWGTAAVAGEGVVQVHYHPPRPPHVRSSTTTPSTRQVLLHHAPARHHRPLHARRSAKQKAFCPLPSPPV